MLPAYRDTVKFTGRPLALRLPGHNNHLRFSFQGLYFQLLGISTLQAKPERLISRFVCPTTIRAATPNVNFNYSVLNCHPIACYDDGLKFVTFAGTLASHRCVKEGQKEI